MPTGYNPTVLRVHAAALAATGRAHERAAANPPRRADEAPSTGVASENRRRVARPRIRGRRESRVRLGLIRVSDFAIAGSDMSLLRRLFGSKASPPPLLHADFGELHDNRHDAFRNPVFELCGDLVR